ncbi:MAG: peptidoglycan-binding domain-containing protein [Pseudomonadota bacterium]
MPNITIYWDGYDGSGAPRANIEVLGHSTPIEIPEEACGFRLTRPDGWDEPWCFFRFGTKQVLEYLGVTYSSAFASRYQVPLVSELEARGPVRGCDSGAFTFTTQLDGVPLSVEDPIIAGAGSFTASFSTERQITWLNHSGVKLPKPTEIPPPELPDPTDVLPPEFFEQPPSLESCIRDFDGVFHCTEVGTRAQAVADLKPTLTAGFGSLLARRSEEILPRFTVTTTPDSAPTTHAASEPATVPCPAELLLTATFTKAPGIAAHEVRYRFHFANGPVSTVFRRTVDGPVTITHSVPLPLPPPVSGGGGSLPSRPTDSFAVYVPLPDQVPSPRTPLRGASSFQVEPLPEGEHRGSVQLEILNGANGPIRTEWVQYHMRCEVASLRPLLTLGSRGPGVHSLQTLLRRSPLSDAPSLRIDGVFGPRTQAAVKTYQSQRPLKVDGVVGRRTWGQLLTSIE